MRILYIGHQYVVKHNHQKIDKIRENISGEVFLITPSRWKSNLTEKFDIKLNKYNIYHLDVKRPGDLKRYTYKKIFPVLKEIQPDIIHIDEEPWSRVCFQIILVSKLFLKKKPKIVLFTWENIYKHFKIHYHLIEQFCIRQAHIIIAGNKEAKQIMIKKGAKAKVKVLPLIGVNLNDYKIKKKRSKRTIHIGYIGRFVKEKGVLLLMEAVNRLVHLKIKLLLLGKGPLLKEMKYFIKKNRLNNKIEIMKSLPHDKVLSFYGNLDIFVLPSYEMKNWKEQFGHVLIEAMSAGVPVICSNSGAIPEVIDKAGLVFKQRDVDDLINKLMLLIKKRSLCSQLKKRAYQHVEKNYTNEVLAKKTIDLYKKILKE